MKLCCVIFLVVINLAGCTQSPPPDGATKMAPGNIHLNQVGFKPGGVKQAVVVGIAADQFQVLNAHTNDLVLTGNLLPARLWAPSGENVRLADFSALASPGEYVVQVAGNTSFSFRISADVYAELLVASLKSFYFNRAGFTLDEQYAGPWARPLGHPDDNVQFHIEAQEAQRNAQSRIASPKGWYDAGDFNKYVVNSGIATYTLLAAYEHFPDSYRELQLGIPESGGDLPDILDEVLWNLDWLETMQDPADGGVYHKLTTLSFAPMVMPHQATENRYLVAKSTDAALNFAAVMAVAARVFLPFDEVLPGYSQRYHQAAEKAWAWAEAHPGSRYAQPADVSTGTYTRPGLADERVWAGAELFLLTGQAQYLGPWQAASSTLSTPDWSSVSALAWVSMANHLDQLDQPSIARVKQGFTQYAAVLSKGQQDSAYGITYGSHPKDFQWGGNAVALNQALLAIQAYRLNPQPQLLALAQGNLNYVLGQNAVGYSFVTGVGDRSPMHIHHRASDADGVVPPVPGLLAGGPNTNGQDECVYPSDQPALSYVDNVCSFTTNEIAINWNAPLVYVAGAIHFLH